MHVTHPGSAVFGLHSHLGTWFVFNAFLFLLLFFFARLILGSMARLKQGPNLLMISISGQVMSSTHRSYW